MLQRGFLCWHWITSSAFVLLAQTNPSQRPLEDYAAKIQVFEAGELFYDRSLNRACGQACAAAAQFQSDIKKAPPDPRHLLVLLRHSDPKVRTLALAALFDNEDPAFLPQMHALVNDSAETFSARQPVADSRIIERKQTVGEIARLLTSYYSPATWMEDQQRGYSAKWFRFKLQRATQGTAPISRDRLPRIAELRRELELVPQPDRAWTLLSLNGPDALVTEAELVTQLKAVGHENILRLLRKQTISSDQSLGPKDENYNGMRKFVLMHASELLLPEDAGFLNASEESERRDRESRRPALVSPWWAIAAAELQPGRSESVLTAAWVRFNSKHEYGDRSDLMSALWRFVGERRLPLLVDWFYGAS